MENNNSFHNENNEQNVFSENNAAENTPEFDTSSLNETNALNEYESSTEDNTDRDNFAHNIDQETVSQQNTDQVEDSTNQDTLNMDSNVNQNDMYQNNIHQNNGYQGYPYQNGAYQYTNAPVGAVPKKPHGNKGFKRVLSYVLTGLVCATLGGTVSAAGILYVLPKTAAFTNTPLYRTVASNGSYSGSSAVLNPLPTVASSGGLTVAQIAQKVGPAVVGVETVGTVQGSDSSGFGWPFDQQQQQQSQQVEGMGSGIIFSKDGYILTNYHVVTDDSSTIAQSITVIFSNGKTASAKVVNFDSAEDLAVIKVTTSMAMPAVAEFGDSSRLQVGDNVVAIGNPLGKDLLGTVTSGIISAVNRTVDIENKTLTLLQTDAAINEGNSGGPLVNSLGQVIGINSAKMNGTGIEGIGFAIPINTVKPELEGLQQSGLKLGIGAEDVTADEAKQYNLPLGVLIDTVDRFSPADNAGIKVNDVIVEFDGQKVTSLAEINKIKFQHKNGDVIKVVVCRSGKNVTLSLKFTNN